MEDDGAAGESCSPLDKPAAAPDTTLARLDRVINDVISDHGLQGTSKQSAGDFTRKELLKLHDNPKVAQLEAVLQKRITEDEARHILFFPDQDQAAYYQKLIADPPKGAPAEHPQRAVQIPHLSLLYLQHWKRWDFVSAFVLSGGLHALCSLFTHDNPVVRLKAITTLVSITAHRDFDWFLPPPRSRAAGPAGAVEGNNTSEARLHRALLGLRLDPAFIPGLIANSWGGSLGGGRKGMPTAAGGPEQEERGGSFPGACLMCLELLAMWLSWVRALHTADGTLRLSRSLLRAIEGWAGKESDSEGTRGWDKGQWVPTLPGSSEQQQQQSPVVGGDGAAGNGSEQGTASTDGEAKPGFAPEVVRARKGTSQPGGETREGEIEGQQGNGSGTAAAAAAAVSDRVPSSDLEAEAMMLKAEREECEKVLELVGKLVADFGRFPPAEQEWEEVNDGGGKDGRELVQGNGGAGGGGAEVGQGCDKTRRSGNGEGGGGGADSEGNSRNNPPGGKEDQPQNIGSGGGHSDDGGECTSVGRDAIDASSSGSTGNALALKLEGNASYKQGRLEEARQRYTTALGILDAAAAEAASSSDGSVQGRMSSSKPGGASVTEAVVLRGVLHRNRAAVALRLFESNATAAALAKDERVATAPQKSSAGGGTGDTNTGLDDRPLAPAVVEPAQRERTLRDRPSSGKGEGRREKEAESARLILESSFALLEVCESDCLRAIEVDAGDKKARLRLDKCRDLRRRCYRGGLVAAAAGREGSSTGYSRQDERLQGRKADLVAKILARAEGSHEIVGGAGADAGGKASDTAPSAPAVTAPSKVGVGTMPVDTGGDDSTAAKGRAFVDGSGERGTAVDLAGGRAPGRETPPAAAGASSARDGPGLLAGRGGGAADHAPREGSELRGDFTPPKKVVGSGGAGAEEAKPRQDEGAKGGGAPTKKKDRKGDAARSRSRPAKTDAAVVRSTRRRLEQAAARAAAAAAPLPSEETEERVRDGCEEGNERRMGSKEAAKEVWRVLVSLPSPSGRGSGDSNRGLSLEKLFGDGITAESLVGVAQGLRHACEIDAERFGAEGAREASSRTERASQLFLELAAVKRIGLASAMCSPKDRMALKDVSDHVRRHVVSTSGCGTGGGGLGGEKGEKEEEQGGRGFRRLLALEAAVLKLGLQP